MLMPVRSTALAQSTCSSSDITECTFSTHASISATPCILMLHPSHSNGPIAFSALPLTNAPIRAWCLIQWWNPYPMYIK
ncbi:hypothetical protein LguiB_030047 [Lonicera macranthoides]